MNLLRSLTAACVLGVSLTATANDITLAESLYQQRGSDLQNALKAASVYQTLAAQASSATEKAKMHLRESEAIYYAAVETTDNRLKISRHEEGQTAATKGINLLIQSEGQPRQASDRELLAELYYYYGANLGKWGEARGVIISLSRWPELKKVTQFVMDLSAPVQWYGGNRIMGRAFLKVPFESSSEGLALLEEAYKKTLMTKYDVTTSVNATTTLYYLEGLKKLDRVNEFCTTYLEFYNFSELSDEQKAEFNSSLIPETKREVREFLKNDEWTGYFEKNC
jgi:hypothetical protein